MKIDIHVHPQFLEPHPEMALPELDSKLDIVADPGHLPIAVEQTAQHYYGRSHVMMPLPLFIDQMNGAGIDKVALLAPAIKGVPERPMN